MYQPTKLGDEGSNPLGDARVMESWSSWFMALVLKTSELEIVPWVRIPHSPPFFRMITANLKLLNFMVV